MFKGCPPTLSLILSSQPTLLHFKVRVYQLILLNDPRCWLAMPLGAGMPYNRRKQDDHGGLQLYSALIIFAVGLNLALIPKVGIF